MARHAVADAWRSIRSRGGEEGGGEARRGAVPDRRELARLPGVLRAPGVDRDRGRAADERDLRVRLDDGQDPHRPLAEGRRSSPGTRAGRGARRSTPSTRRSASRGPDLLKEQWPHLAPLAEAFGFATSTVEGYEADDVIATLARQASGAGIPVMIVSGDRDVYQLVGDGVRVMTTSRGVTDTKIYDRDGRDRALRRSARAGHRLHRPQGRHLRQHPRRPRDRRQDRRPAAPAVRRPRGRARLGRRDLGREAQAEPDRARRRRPGLEAAGDDGRGRRRADGDHRGAALARPTARSSATRRTSSSCAP